MYLHTPNTPFYGQCRWSFTSSLVSHIMFTLSLFLSSGRAGEWNWVERGGIRREVDMKWNPLSPPISRALRCPGCYHTGRRRPFHTSFTQQAPPWRWSKHDQRLSIFSPIILLASKQLVSLSRHTEFFISMNISYSLFSPCHFVLEFPLLSFLYFSLFITHGSQPPPNKTCDGPGCVLLDFSPCTCNHTKENLALFILQEWVHIIHTCLFAQ